MTPTSNRLNAVVTENGRATNLYANLTPVGKVDAETGG
jgi:hypothetical protein